MQRHYRQQQSDSRLHMVSKLKSKSSSMDSGKRIESNDCVSSTSTVASSSFSPPKARSLNNLERFLEHTLQLLRRSTSLRALRIGTPTAKGNAACALLRLSRIEDSKIEIGRSGAIPLLMNLLETGNFNRSCSRSGANGAFG
ncbi:hypothetical protein U1Q18_017511 [Sarracenia purpurea var. burkii]